MAHLNRVLAALIAGCLLLAGCTPAPTPQPSSVATSATASAETKITISATSSIAVDRPTFAAVTPKVAGLVTGLAGSGLSPYLDQKLTWTSCGDGTTCATVLAPLDYADPNSRAVTLSLRKKAATEGPSLGVLFINPGGPGGSGKDLVTSFDTTGLERYDIVGWDPRGTGDSTPVRCLSDAEQDAYNELDFSPDNDQERTALIEAAYNFGKACWQANGDLLDHIGTVDTVRDLDLLRQLLDQKKLNFVGYSYGTQIGATYAELFGQNTGRLVLDAAVNITEDDSVIQAQGFDLALANFADWCAGRQCSLGSTRQAVEAKITDLFDALDARPLKVGDRRLTQSLAVTGVAALLYSGADGYATLEMVIKQARSGSGTNLLSMADQMNDRDDKGHYATMAFAFPAISCLDGRERGVLDADKVWLADQKKAPIFGKYFGPQYGCALWPTRPSTYLQLRLHGAAAAPLLVIGGKGDNATPYQYAVSMAAQLKSATLITYAGVGHGSFGGKSACIDKIVVNYLVAGDVPRRATTCQP